MSAKFSLAKEDGEKILKVLAYSVASAVIAALISLVSDAKVPPELVILIPVVNTVLVAAKKFFEDNPV